MIYLDYSATYPTKKEVLETFVKTSELYIGNSNSIHNLGIESYKLIKEATAQVAFLLGVKESEIIYTSGASEGNNHIIKSICENQKTKNIILTTKYEHPSVNGPLNYLKEKNFIVKYLKTYKNGIVDLKELEKEDFSKVALTTICAVNSEIGIRQPIEKIGYLLKNKCPFHSDLTQIIGKQKISFKNLDFATFSAHKFGGFKGIGITYKKETKIITPLIHSENYEARGGTPPTELIVSTSKALRLALEKVDKNYKIVEILKESLIENLSKVDELTINSNDYCIPHIVNFSVNNIKPETVVNALSKNNIFISTQTACSSKDNYSKTIFELTKDMKKAKTSLRVSIASITNEDEINQFVSELKKIINKCNETK